MGLIGSAPTNPSGANPSSPGLPRNGARIWHKRWSLALPSTPHPPPGTPTALPPPVPECLLSASSPHSPRLLCQPSSPMLNSSQGTHWCRGWHIDKHWPISPKSVMKVLYSTCASQKGTLDCVLSVPNLLPKGTNKPVLCVF